MRAVLVTKPGELPSLGQIPAPILGEVLVPGFPIDEPQVPPRETGPHPASLIEVSYAAINPIDLHVASGAFFQGLPQVPYVPGVEGVGRVVESETLPAGTRVRFELGHPGYGANGSMAELTAVDDAGLVELPESVADEDAAALGNSAITAGRVLDLAEMSPGETVLVLGASGAIGKVAVQMARHHGAGQVIAAGRDAGRLERAVDLGADHAVSLAGKSPEEVAAELRELGGVDVVIDPLWGEPAMAALAAGNFGIRLVNFGLAAGRSVDMSSIPLRNNRATVKGISTAMDSFEVRRASFVQGLDLLESGGLVVDHQVFPMGEVAEAWQAQRNSPGARLLLAIG
jgi:NADPH:quinone reductase-like Zn-dependent oxidoreductase